VRAPRDGSTTIHGVESVQREWRQTRSSDQGTRTYRYVAVMLHADSQALPPWPCRLPAACDHGLRGERDRGPRAG
jgi:hypothetical protein